MLRGKHLLKVLWTERARHRHQPGRATFRQYVVQADSDLRPLLRRAEMMERPARVRMRARKPCLRLRRRLLGWKVRLLTVYSQNGWFEVIRRYLTSIDRKSVV